uniref:Terminal nucleotidyltransferase 4A n=1 Tax=Ciona savignyi TaxID=51511 RepID=H2YFN4_CIOSA
MDQIITHQLPTLDTGSCRDRNLLMNFLRTVEVGIKKIHLEYNQSCPSCQPHNVNIKSCQHETLHSLPMRGFNESTDTGNFIPLKKNEGSPLSKKKNFQTSNEDGSVSPPHGGKKRRENLNVHRPKLILGHYPHSAGAPWVVRNYCPGMVGLHEEIEDFYNFMRPTETERRMREHVIKSVEDVVKSLWPTCKLDVFGSFCTNLYLPTSDIDIALFGQWENLPLWTLTEALIKNELVESGSEKVLDRAAVPIIKFQHKGTLIKVDISFNIRSGVQSVDLIKDFMKKYPVLPKLIFVLKQFLLVRELNEVWTGGVSSYSLILMAISFIQLHPRNDSRDASCNLGVLLIEFFELYGRFFNYHSTCIRVKNGGRYITKEEFRNQMDNGCQPALLSIEDPLTLGNDLGRGSYAVMQVKQAFEHALRVLTNAIHYFCNNRIQASLLSQIVNVPDDIVLHRRLACDRWREYIEPNLAVDTNTISHQPSGYCSTSSRCSSDSSSDAPIDTRSYLSSESSSSSLTTDSDSESLLDIPSSPCLRRNAVHSKSSECLSNLRETPSLHPRKPDRTHSADKRNCSADKKLPPLTHIAPAKSSNLVPSSCKLKKEEKKEKTTQVEKLPQANSRSTKDSQVLGKTSTASNSKVQRSLISFTSSKSQQETKQNKKTPQNRHGSNSSRNIRKATSNRVASANTSNDCAADR